VVEQWILAAIRKITFFDLHQLNGVIKEKLDVMNNKPFQKMDGPKPPARIASKAPRMDA